MPARLTGKHFINSLCHDDTKFSEMLPHLDECVRTAVEFSKDVVDVGTMKEIACSISCTSSNTMSNCDSHLRLHAYIVILIT